MLTAGQCFIHIETLSKTADKKAFELAVAYINQVPPSDIGQLRDKVRELPGSKFITEVLDVLDARAKRT
jgi:hypothetical protein